MSEGLIYKLISQVMASVGSVEKNRKNEQQKYSFRGIEDLYLAAHPALVKHGVFCAPNVIERTEYRFERVNDYGKTTVWLHVTLKIVHKFYASDGSFIEVTTIGEGLDNSDKASSKAMSGAMKYALIELFCVPTQDVEDSDRTTPESGMARPVSDPVTLVPTPPKPPKEAPPVPAELPDEETRDVSESPYISKHQKQYLAKRFREAIRPEKQSEAEIARHAALGALAMSGKFKSRFTDDNGNPTSEFILIREYADIGRMLVQAAKSL